MTCVCVGCLLNEKVLEFCLIKWEFLDVLCLKTLDSFTKLCKEMVDLAKQAFSTNNFCLAAEIYERTIRENGPNAELFLGLADSLARVGQFSKAFNAYTNAYRYGQVTPGKLKHLVIGLIQTVKQDLVSSGVHEEKQQSCMFTCGVCRGLLADPVTLPCGHTFCRNCLEKDKSKPCEICNTVHYRLKLKNIKTNVVLANLVQKLFPNQCNASVLKKEGNEHFAKRDYINAIESYTKAICIGKTILTYSLHIYNNKKINDNVDLLFILCKGRAQISISRFSSHTHRLMTGDLVSRFPTHCCITHILM